MLLALHFLILGLFIFTFCLSCSLVIYSFKHKRIWLYIAVPVFVGFSFELFSTIVAAVNNWPKLHTPLSATSHNIGVICLMIGIVIGFITRKRIISS